MLKKKLKLALKNAGLSEALADRITVKSEAEIAEVIEQLKPSSGGSDDDDPDIDIDTILESEALSQYVEKHGIDALLKKNKKIKSGFDRKVTDANNTYKTNLEKKLLGGGNAGDDVNDDDPDETDDMKEAPAWAKAIVSRLDKVEKEKTTSSKLEKAKEALEKSKLPKHIKAKWLNRINLESDESLDDQVKGLEEEYKELHAAAIGQETYEFPDNSKEKEGGKNGELKKSDLDYLSKAAKNL